MSRLTITLSEPRYIALKEASVQRGKTMRQWVQESLECYGIKFTMCAARATRHDQEHHLFGRRGLD